jgi:molybdate transport repressor ModE-like protein
VKLRGKVWLESAGGHVLGRGRAALLDAVARHGSLAQAARDLGMSYRHAWSMLRAAERNSGHSLVHARRGGAGGGGSYLTDHGRLLLCNYRDIESRFQAFLQEMQDEMDDAPG